MIRLVAGLLVVAPGRLAVGDINGDGRPDIVTADVNVTVSLQQ